MNLNASWCTCWPACTAEQWLSHISTHVYTSRSERTKIFRFLPLRCLRVVFAVGQFSRPVQKEQGQHQAAGQREHGGGRHEQTPLMPAQVQCGGQDGGDHAEEEPHHQGRCYGRHGVQGPLFGLVRPLFGSRHLAWPWATDNAEDAEGAEGEDHRGEERDEDIDAAVEIPQLVQADGRAAEQPSAADTDVPQPDPGRLSEPHVSDGMDDGQVAVHAGEEVKQRLSCSGGGQDRQHGGILTFLPRDGGVVVEGSERDAEQLQQDHVEGEHVGVACGGGAAAVPPPPPALEAHVEDEEEERDEEDVAEQVDGEGHEVLRRGEAALEPTLDGRVGRVGPRAGGSEGLGGTDRW